MSLTNGYQRHHYNPQFYLRRWENSEQKFFRYTVIHHRVICELKNANTSGFERYLYSLEDVPVEYKNIIETECFGDIDNKGAKLLEKIEKNEINLSNQEQKEWARFIYAMISRTPKIIEAAKSIGEINEEEYQNLSPSEQEWYNQSPENFKKNAGLVAIAAALTPQNPFGLEQLEEFADVLLNMYWFFSDIPDSRSMLITSDNPVRIFPLKNERSSYDLKGTSPSQILQTGKCYLYFPLSPHKAFFAFPTNNFEAAKFEFYNARLAYYADRYVYARNKMDNALIENMLSKKHQLSCAECQSITV